MPTTLPLVEITGVPRIQHLLQAAQHMLLAALVAGSAWTSPDAQAGVPRDWQKAWPHTDFTRARVPLEEFVSGGPGRDGIPAIDRPRFITATDVTDLAPDEPVIGLVVGDEAKAYPLRTLIWHEIVNDEIGGVPVTVTYCPLCNTSIVFDRRIDERVLDFGTTGMLRHSDLVMYDRQTESWWQQFSGQAIVGRLAGRSLSMLPSRLESWENFRQRAPSGRVLVPNDPRARRYGANPYVGYDRSPFPFLFRGKVPRGIAPMMRVVAVDDLAFTLPLVRDRGTIEHEGLEISWTSGQRSALDRRRVDKGDDVGNIVVKRDGAEVPHVVTFAFAFFAFNPRGTLLTNDGIRRGNVDSSP